MACDICGKTGRSLNRLLDCHQTEDIKDVCDDCEKVLNDQKRKLQQVATRIFVDWFRAFMVGLKGGSR